MASKSILVDINLNKNELQNAVIQNLASAPSNPIAGQIYYNTADKILYTYDGENWVAGKQYTFSSPLSESGGTVTVGNASTSAKGVIEIATDTEASTGTSTSLAVTPKQLATKVTANTSITGATKCKITYDAKGLVTSGADLQASDIPSLDSSKVTTMGSYSKASSSAAIATTDSVDTAIGKLEYKADNAVVANTAITAGSGTVISYDTKGLITSSSEIGIASDSTNYLGFDTSTHKISAKVDTTVTDSSTNLITSGAVSTAIANAVVGGVLYKGTWAITTSTTDFSGITLPVKKGYLYYVTGTGPATVDGIEWNPGDYLLVNDDVASGGSLSGKVEKVDNTEAADIVRVNATQILTNKTIDADDNTISDLTTSNLKSGVLQTTVRAIASATDTAIASEKAIRTELDTKQNNIPAGTANYIVAYSGTEGTVNSLTRRTSIRATSSASDTAIPTEKAVASALSSLPHKITANNTALTSSSGVCTWSITNTLATEDVTVSVYEISSKDQVFPAVTVGSSTITIKINSSTNIAADTYKVVIIG